jgi:hypothetical protein
MTDVKRPIPLVNYCFKIGLHLSKIKSCRRDFMLVVASLCMDNSDLIEENREALETVANADLPASWAAEELLQSIDGDSNE